MKLSKYLKEKQLKMAEVVEKEHLGDKKLRTELKNELKKMKGNINSKNERDASSKAARIIGKAHVKELPDYYDKLKEIEKW